MKLSVESDNYILNCRLCLTIYELQPQGCSINKHQTKLIPLLFEMDTDLALFYYSSESPESPNSSLVSWKCSPPALAPTPVPAPGSTPTSVP